MRRWWKDSSGNIDPWDNPTDAAVGEPAPEPALEPQSLADQLVTRAERSRDAVLDRASREWQTAQAIVYVGDAVLALTERLTELER